MKKIFFLIFFLAINAICLFPQTDWLPETEKTRIEIRQKTIKKDLDSCRIKGYANLTCDKILDGLIDFRKVANVDYKLLSNELIYTENHRQRILEVLNNEWPNWELEAMIQNSLTYRTRFEKFDAEEIAKTDTSRTVDIILDSLLKSRYEELRNRYKNDFHWHKPYAEVASFINEPRFVEPIRKAYFNDTAFYGFCLARAGVEPYLSNEENKLINKMKADPLGSSFDVDLVYFGLRTQPILKQFSEYLLSDYKYDMLGGNDYMDSYHAKVATILFLLLANEDLPKLYSEEEREEFNYPEVQYALSFYPFTKEHAKRLYDWMQENYGNYKIRPF